MGALESKIVLCEGAHPWSSLFQAEGARVLQCRAADRGAARREMERILADSRGIDMLMLAGQSWSPLEQMALPHLRSGGWILTFVPPGETNRVVPVSLVAHLAERGIGVLCLAATPDRDALRALVPPAETSRFFLGY